MLENKGIEIKNVPSFEDAESDEVVGARGGAIIPFVPKEIATSIPETENSDIRDDYITSRNITHTLIDMAGSALQGALDVAIETQHPKAYTVFNELATTMRGLSKDLLEMQKIYKEISAEKKAAQEAAKKVGGVTNNLNITTHSASLADVLKMIKDGVDPNTIDLNSIPAEVIDNE
jgi:hypothetical protein